MTKTRKIEIAIIIGAMLVLGTIWAINGYEDTWLYATAAIITIPASWLYFSKNGKNQ